MLLFAGLPHLCLYCFTFLFVCFYALGPLSFLEALLLKLHKHLGAAAAAAAAAVAAAGSRPLGLLRAVGPRVFVSVYFLCFI